MCKSFKGRASFFCLLHVAIICALAAVIAGSLSANATTITVREYALAANQANPDANYSFISTTVDTVNPPNGATAVSAETTVTPGGLPGPAMSDLGGTSYGYGYANSVTGALRAKAENTNTTGTEDTHLTAMGDARIIEMFAGVDTGCGFCVGTVTAYLNVTGNYNLTPDLPTPVNFQLQAGITFSGGTNTYDVIARNSSTDPLSGTINQTLMIQGFISTGGPLQFLTLDTYLLAQILNGLGTIDLSGTALLAVLFDLPDGMAVVPTDDRFLSQAVFDPNSNAVPLPAALPLFASGVLFLGFLGRQRKKRLALAKA